MIGGSRLERDARSHLLLLMRNRLVDHFINHLAVILRERAPRG